MVYKEDTETSMLNGYPKLLIIFKMTPFERAINEKMQG